MKSFFGSLFGGLAALFLFFIILPIMFLMFFALSASLSGGNKLPKSMVLEFDLRQQLADQPATQGFDVLFDSEGFIDVLQKLDAAADDPRVKGVYIRASEYGVGSSRAEELRQAFLKLKDNGKFIVAHSQGMNAGGPSSLRAIAPADELWLQPGADILVNGISFETLFMKDLFDKLSISAEIEQFYEYKNSPNQYKQTDYTDAHREAMTELANDLWTISLSDIAQDRGFESTADLKSLLESGPLSPTQVIDAGLFTDLKWPEDAYEAAKELGGSDAKMVSIFDYSSSDISSNAPVIAVVGGEGAIVTGYGNSGPFGGDRMIASDRIAAAILAAGRNDNVDAILFRVDSGGGSAIASDQIWRAVQRVREDMGKPVVVSMGRVAASGGYYVSAGADSIFALRSTITGSIGVYGGKFAIADGLRKIGINPSTISVGGEFANAWSSETFTDNQREQLRATLGRTYDRFMEVVSEGREMPEADVRELAKGRVWSGVDALELNLVNENGGFLDALNKAKELAGIAEDTEVNTLFYPRPEDPFQSFGSALGASAETASTLNKLNTLMSNEEVRAFLQQVEALDGQEAQMSAPVYKER